MSEKRTRVLINALSARQGGGQTYLVNLLRYLPDGDGLEILLLAPDSLDIPKDDPRISRLHVDWPVGNPFVRAVWERFVLARMLVEQRVDVLFCPGGIIGTRVPPGCRSVTMSRNMMPFDLEQRKRYPLGYMRVRNWLLQRVQLRSMLKADLVIFISHYAKGVIESFAGRRLAHTVVIPHGINPMFCVTDAGRIARPEWLPDGEYLLYVSIFDVYKAQLEVVRGYALARQVNPNLPRLVLIGPDTSSYADSVRQECQRLGLDEHVLILGDRPYRELPGAYMNASANIFASECENCPNILLEAMAAGRPLLVSDRQPMPEFAGDAALYFNPSEPETFADQLLNFLGNKVLQEQLAGRSLERSQLFNWERAAAQTWKVILGLGKRGNASVEMTRV